MKAAKHKHFTHLAGKCFYAWSNYTYLVALGLDRKRWPGPRKYEVSAHCVVEVGRVCFAPLYAINALSGSNMWCCLLANTAGTLFSAIVST
jgi:hypothetical protein